MYIFVIYKGLYSILITYTNPIRLHATECEDNKENV